MSYKLVNLTNEQINLVVLRALSVLENKEYNKIYNWPFEDISVDHLFSLIKEICANHVKKNKFIKFCLNHISKNKDYSLIEGIFNLIIIFEQLERYEDCVILKNIKDDILLDLQHSIL